MKEKKGNKRKFKIDWMINHCKTLKSWGYDEAQVYFNDKCIVGLAFIPNGKGVYG